MKQIFICIIGFLLISGCAELEKEEVRAHAYFCPEDNCSLQIISAINSAEESVDIAVYSFTLDSIADALVRAEQRGVEVGVVFDYVQSFNEYSEDETLERSGVYVIRKKGDGLMHNKFLVVDERLVVTGSFNYSRSADTKNDENLVFIYNKDVAEKYSREFDELLYESEKNG